MTMLLASLAGVALFCGAMVCAGLDDLRRMRIENRLVLVLLAGYAVLAPLSGFTIADLSRSAAVAGVVLLLGFLLFAAGWIGGGDAKLAAVTALWLGAEHVLDYILLLSLLGALLTLGILLLRAASLPQPWAEAAFVRNLYSRRRGIPYGVALSVAGLWVFVQSPWLITVYQL
ncbi:A24 family peptidase [Alkalilacustris brevis]|uniref:A24 family peptidase n=1 Tax=Alkalilacustris brevis TaxID=2026338 RepID=UPI000E0D95B1|nr:prepilin peptidase [Alkalilacustris brevis]